MVKKSLRGKRTKKKYTKKENKRYKKRYTKRNTKNNNLKGGRLTPRQQELLRKVNRRTDYCRKKNKFQKRDFNDCSSKVVCKWGLKRGETSERCMKDDEAIRSLNYGLFSDYYPPFTKVLFRASDGSEKETTISEIISLKDEIGETPLMVKIEGDDWKLLSQTNILESPVQAQAPPPPPRDHEPEPEPVTHDDTRPVVDSAVVDAWINERGEREYPEMTSETRGKCHSSNNPSDNCVYFNPQTNIDIVSEVLKREAKSGSNIYLNIDAAHGRLTGQETSLNSNLHLLLIPSRGTQNEGRRGVITITLSIMKKFLDDKGHEDLFNGDGCMTLKGSLLFYNLALIWTGDIRPGKILKIGELKEHGYTDENELPFSDFYRIINKDKNWLGGRWRSPGIIKSIVKKIMFRILKLYNPGDCVNDTLFGAKREERERMSGESHKTGFVGGKNTKFGLTILYTNDDNINKYIHLPLEGTGSGILLSQILNYLKPLENLNHKFFMNHGSCRVDGEFYKDGYNPDLSSLTREISTPKENAHKNCFINYFEEPQRKEVRRVLRRFPTLFDYYRWLKNKEKIDDYIDILTEHGEGSQKLYEFIMKNHK